MKKILTIDDVQDNLITVSAILESFMPECKVYTALSGQEGIDTARKEQPDTILLDIIMPNMDGYEVCKILKSDPKTKNIPVIMLTAIKTDAQSRIKGLENGADAFLSKPIDPTELSAQINVMLRIKAAEDELREEKRDLESLVSERTAELRDSYENLKQEVKSRKLSDKALQESEEKFRTIAEQVSDLIFLTDDKGTIKYISPTSSSIFGLSPEEMEGKLFMQFLKKTEIPKAMKEFMKTFVKGEPTINLELLMKHKNGNYFIGELTGRKYISEKLKGTIGVIRDITELQIKIQVNDFCANR